MKLKSVVLWLSWLTLIVFTVAFVGGGNYEFIMYAVTLAVLLGLVQYSSRYFNYPEGVLVCFWLWLVMHMCGGFVQIGGVRLYDVILLDLVPEPYYILRYDQFVHAFCYLAIGGLLKTVIVRVLPKGSSLKTIALLTFLTALGVGAVNEIIEFMAVAFFDAAEGVGDYYNNALDLVFNAIGAVAALAWPIRKKRLPVP